VARAAPQPTLSPGAASLLSAYYLYLRACQEAQQGVLPSLARVAAAAARLRHSPTVEAVPDAALAVAYVEEKLLAAGAAPGLWPRWREELQRCTELGECLRGLAEDAGTALGLGLGAGRVGSGSGAGAGAGDGYAGCAWFDDREQEVAWGPEE